MQKTPESVDFAGVPAIAPKSFQMPDKPHEETILEVKEEGSKEVRKFTSKLESGPSDQPVNKVGYYFTRKEMDRLDALYLRLKPILRDQYNKKVTKNEIIRACLIIGLRDWEENNLTSELVHLLTSK
jgi:hypothetical protein